MSIRGRGPASDVSLGGEGYPRSALGRVEVGGGLCAASHRARAVAEENYSQL